MKTNTWTWIAVVGLLLIGMLIGWQLTNAFTPKPPVIKSDTVKTPFDTTDFIAHLKPIIIQNYKDTGSIKWYPNNIYFPVPTKLTSEDTLRILADYFATKFDTATIVNDSLLWFKLNYGITQGRLVSADGKYFIKRPQTIINNNPSQPLKNQLYLGVKLDGLSTGFGIGGTIVLKTRKDAIWNAGVDYIPVLSKKPIYSVGRNFKISF